MKEPGQIDLELLNVIYEREGMAAVEAAVRADERERCAKVADKPEWIGCANCNAVLNEWFTYNCPKYDEWIFSEQGKKMILLDGAHCAERYFEKHVCGRFDRLDHQKVGPAIAAAIRKLAEGP